MAVNDIIMLTTVFECNGVASANNSYYEETIAPGTPDTRDLILAWNEDLRAAFVAMLSSEGTIACVIQKVLNPAEGPAYPEFQSTAGGIGGDAMPMNKMVCATMYGIDPNVPIVRVRNNQLISGLPESGVSGNVINSAQIAFFNAYVELLPVNLTSSAGGTYEPRVQQVAKGMAPVGPNYFPMAESLWDNAVKVVRRRNSTLCNPV